MKSAGKARSNGLYRHIRTSKEIIRNLLNDYINQLKTIIRGYCSPPCGISWYDSDSIDMASILLPRNAISILIIIRDKSMAHTHLLMMTS